MITNSIILHVIPLRPFLLMLYVLNLPPFFKATKFLSGELLWKQNLVPGPYVPDHPTKKLFEINGFFGSSKKPMGPLIGIKLASLLRGLIQKMELTTLKRSAQTSNPPPFGLFLLLLFSLVGLCVNWLFQMLFSMALLLKKCIWRNLVGFLILSFPTMFAGYIKPYMALNKRLVLGTLSFPNLLSTWVLLNHWLMLHYLLSITHPPLCTCEC